MNLGFHLKRFEAVEQSTVNNPLYNRMSDHDEKGNSLHR